MKHEPIAIGGKREGDCKCLRVVEGLLHAVPDAVIVVFRLDGGNGDVWLVVEDVIRTLAFASRDELARTVIRPLVKVTSSRICRMSSHPARCRAGVMNFEQMSRSERFRLSIPSAYHKPLGQVG